MGALNRVKRPLARDDVYATARARSSTRRWAVVLVTPVTIAFVVGLLVPARAGSTPKGKTLVACSLLTSTQARQLLQASGQVEAKRLRPPADGCDFVSTQNSPGALAESLFFTLEKAPAKFPIGYTKEYGHPIELDGRTAYFEPFQGEVSQELKTNFLLVAVKGGYELMVQDSVAMPRQEVIARQAMKLVLPKL
jgi:hypothetical protein